MLWSDSLLARDLRTACAALAAAVFAELFLQARAARIFGALGEPAARGAALGAGVALEALRAEAFTALEARAVVAFRRGWWRSGLVRRFGGAGARLVGFGAGRLGGIGRESGLGATARSEQRQRKAGESNRGKPSTDEVRAGESPDRPLHRQGAYTLVRERARRVP